MGSGLPGHRLAESILWNWFLGSIKVLNTASVRFTSQVCFFRFDLAYFWNKPSLLRFDLFKFLNNRLRFVSIVPICGINRVRSASIFQICGINRVRFASIFLISGISRVPFTSIFPICGINRIHFSSISLRCRISRVCFASIFTSSGIIRFVSLRYRKCSQDQSFVPPSFRYHWHY